MKKIIGLLLVLLTICILLCPEMTPLSAQDAPHPALVRVGYMNNPGFLQRKDDGSYDGYAYAYLNELAKYTGWKYEFVYGDVQTLQRMMDSGDIDILCSYSKTESRTEKYDFTSYSLGLEATDIYILPDTADVYYADFKAFEGMRIAVMAGTHQQEALRAYAARHHFSYEEVLFKVASDMFAALDNHDVQAVAACTLFRTEKYKIVGQASLEPYYIITRKGRDDDLIQQFDSAILKVRYAEPAFESNLQQKYYSNTASVVYPSYTREEMEYIRTHPVVRVGNFAYRFPFTYYSPHSEKIEGITIDILELISQMSGLRFEYDAVPPGESPLVYLRNNHYDMVTGIVRNAERLGKTDIVLTQPYFSGKMVLVGAKKLIFQADRDYRIAIPEDALGIRRYILEAHPNYTILTYKDSEACMDAVNEGAADVMMQNTYIVSALLQLPRFDGLGIWSNANMPEEDYSFVCRSDVDPLLISIMDKSIRALDRNRIEGMILKRTASPTYGLTVKDIFHKYNSLLLTTGFFLLIFFLFFLYAYVQKRKNVTILTEKNAQLSDAIAQAEFANHAKSQFLSRMSHEIRTPLNAIMGMTTLALKHLGERSHVEGYLHKIAMSSQILLNIINDILDMSAIEEEKLKIGHAPFDLSAVLKSLTDMYREQCAHKGLQFTVEDTVQERCLVGDSRRLTQILLNLLSNAVKFTPDGGAVTIRVGQRDVRQHHVYLHFEVADTGIGMSEEFMHRLFQPFEQDSPMTFQKYGGSGLGLSIAKNLTELMEGKLSVASVLKEGTTFFVDIPFERAEQAAAAQAEPVVEPVRADMGRQLQGRTILLAEDNDLNMEIAVELLEMCGARMVTARNGREAVEKFTAAAAHTYDLILMDIQMPEMNGYEAAHAIRTSPKEDAKTIPIIAMTANAFAEDVAQALAAGMNEHIAKPMDLDKVLGIIGHFLK
jgi:signal transduction histidine kinase/ActR/RegA family two-component response regulator